MGEPRRVIAGAIATSAERATTTSVGIRRRHRPLTGTAGVLLFACMFLPAVRGCGDAYVTPLDAPPFLPPYLYGLVFALVALARTRRHLAAGVLALRVLAATIAFSGFVMVMVAPTIGIIELSVGTVLIAAIGTREATETRVALSVVVLGAIATLWFALWCGTGRVLLGVELSLVSSLALLNGGLVWLAETVHGPRSNLPTAFARVRRSVLRSRR